MTSTTASPAERMDRMYRWTRHVYDLTRRYYLLGRDRMLRDVADRPPGHVLEVGCGTARNLRRLHHQAPHHMLYGLDASQAMLNTAQHSLRRAGCARDIRLAQGLAGDLDPETHFGRESGFDVLFFSYVLSMIPAWPAAVDTALQHLRPGGALYVVDFWDQRDLPAPVAGLLQRWLALFDVHHRPALLDHFRRLDDAGRVRLDLTSVARRYAYIARLEKR
jgi:S-adenosylmethionine-diacylgycerolhomoserine-N-methlytransferase